MGNTIYGRPGERNLNSKTSSQAVAIIRYLSQYKPWTTRALAQQFGLSSTTVHKILHGEIWKDVDQQHELNQLETYISLLRGGDASEARSSRTVVSLPTTTVVETEHQLAKPSQIGDKRSPLGNTSSPVEMSELYKRSLVEISEGKTFSDSDIMRLGLSRNESLELFAARARRSA